MSIRMRLFESTFDTDCSDTELDALLTPKTKGDNSPDSGVWSDTECSLKKQSNHLYRHTVTPGSRKSLFPVRRLPQRHTIDEETSRSWESCVDSLKRLAEFEEAVEESPSSKRLRLCFNRCHIREGGLSNDWHLDNCNDHEEVVPASLQVCDDKNRCISRLGITNPPQIIELSSISHEEQIVQAVETLTSESCRIADGSRDYCLPTIPSKQSDLKCMSVDTLCAVIMGDYSDLFDAVTIVDCRYPYEFDGGHIKGAVNLYTRDDVRSLLWEPSNSDKRRIVVFHCEFSSERGPKMSRFLRSEDRDLNKDRYPMLHFPEVYLLDGGYKAFYSKYSSVCEPRNYIPMLHEDHANDLRHFRVKSKSWTSGERHAAERRNRLLNSRSRKSMEF